MKKLFTMVIALAAFASSALALDNEPKDGMSYQAFLGFTASKIRGLDGYDGKVGGTAGFKVEYVLPKAHGTYINAGVDWTQKGAKTDDLLSNGVVTTSKGNYKYNLHYIEIPIHVGFHYNFSQEVGVFGEVGPYFGIGVAGKHRLSLDEGGAAFRAVEDDYTYQAFKKSTQLAPVTKYNFQRWDAGVGFRVGGEYNQHYILALGMDWGITNMWRQDFVDAVADNYGIKPKDVKNYTFYMTLGYRF